MSPAERIAEQFQSRGLDFCAYINLHLLKGFVFSTPEFFIMGRAVVRHAHQDLIRDPEFAFHEGATYMQPIDAWWIHAMAGDCSKAWSILPHELPFIGFERFDKDLRFYPIATLRRLTIPTNEMAFTA